MLTDSIIALIHILLCVARRILTYKTTSDICMSTFTIYLGVNHGLHK